MNDRDAEKQKKKFLREAWECVYAEDNDRWIDASIISSKRRPDIPCAGTGPALERLLALGASREDIIAIVRDAQYSTLFGLCELLDEHWQVFAVGEDGRPTVGLEGLHEGVLSADPTGREMRPKRPG